MEFISEGIFGKYSKMKILVLKKRVGYVYREESFDNILNLGTTPPSPMGYGWGKSPMAARVNYLFYLFEFDRSFRWQSDVLTTQRRDGLGADYIYYNIYIYISHSHSQYF